MMLILYASCLTLSRIALGQGTVVAAELVIPAAVVVLGAEDRRRLLPSSVEQFQNVMLLHLRGLQKEPFIQNQEPGIGILHKRLPVVVLRPGNLQIQQQIRETDVSGFEALLAGFHAQSAGHIGLAAARGAGDKDVPELCNVFTGSQSFNQCPVQLPARGVINIGNNNPESFARSY